MMRALVALTLVAGCGRLDFDVTTDAATDANNPDGACTLGPWGTPQRILSASTPVNDWGGQITADGLAYYYASYTSGPGDLVVVRRASRTASFGPPAAITELSAPSDEGEVSISPDEREIYFSSDRGGSRCIWHASRASASVPFSAPSRLDALCASGEALGPYISADGLRLYYHRVATDPLGRLQVSTRATPTDVFAPGANVFSDQTDRGFPALSGDELTLYWEQGEPHHMHQVSRADVAAPFPLAGITEVPGPNLADPTHKYEDVSITADGKTLVFSSDRDGGSGDDDPYLIERDCVN